MLTATSYFNAITRDYAQSLTRTAASTTVARETKYYLDTIGKVKTVDDLLKNDKLYTYVMTAYGLTDMLKAKGLIRKVLEGGISGYGLADTLHDARYKALATAFDFPTHGTDTTSTTAARQGTVDKYVELALESSTGKQNEGARLALYFQRRAPSISSETSILADGTLLKVVQTALGLSPLMSYQSIDRQAMLIGKHLDIDDLRNPVKLQRFIERFTANYDASNRQSAPAATSALTVTSVGISPSLLIGLANLKLGGG